ncbi:MAG: dihydrolipoyl dehydrogenase [Planctomycetes bacterium]|nr:dihydrolipoyl dehydrogenase [Planctomycetota bacterium]
MASPRTPDVAVIGAGPGGYVAAIRLAQLGKKVLVVERARLGGVCLNIGCIPSKALIHAATLVDRIRHAGEMGITVGAPTVDMKQLMAWKSEVVKKLTGGVGVLLKGNGIETLIGDARFVGPQELEVVTAKGPERVKAGAFLIATGSRPISIPGFTFDGTTVISSTEALELDALPRSMTVIGGGVIGLEIGTLYAKLGTEVTVVELTPTLLPGTDPDLVTFVARSLKRRGVKVYLKSKAKGQTPLPGGGGVRVALETEKGDVTVDAEKVLVCVGVRPNTEKLGLEAAGVALTGRGHVKVDAQFRTSAAGIFAIGDVAGPPMLAHKASKEGMVAAEAICGRPTRWDVRAMPGAIFTDPEIATVGLTDEQAEQAGHTVAVGKFPFGANGRALAIGEGEGFVKVVTDKKTGLVLGCGIVGPEASTVIAEAALAIELGATAEDLALTVHAHPTLPEALMEACEAAGGHAIHALGRIER